MGNVGVVVAPAAARLLPRSGHGGVRASRATPRRSGRRRHRPRQVDKRRGVEAAECANELASGRAGGRRRGWRRRKARPSRRESHPERSATILRGGVTGRESRISRKAARDGRTGWAGRVSRQAARAALRGEGSERRGEERRGGRARVRGRQGAPGPAPVAARSLRLGQRRRGDRGSQARRCRHLERLGARKHCSLRPSRCASGWTGERTESRPCGAASPEAPGRAAVYSG